MSEQHRGPEIVRETTRLFEKTKAQFEGFFEGVGNLSKKNPDDAVTPLMPGKNRLQHA